MYTIGNHSISNHTISNNSSNSKQPKTTVINNRSFTLPASKVLKPVPLPPARILVPNTPESIVQTFEASTPEDKNDMDTHLPSKSSKNKGKKLGIHPRMNNLDLVNSPYPRNTSTSPYADDVEIQDYSDSGSDLESNIRNTKSKSTTHKSNSSKSHDRHHSTKDKHHKQSNQHHTNQSHTVPLKPYGPKPRTDDQPSITQSNPVNNPINSSHSVSNHKSNQPANQNQSKHNNETSVKQSHSHHSIPNQHVSNHSTSTHSVPNQQSHKHRKLHTEQDSDIALVDGSDSDDIALHKKPKISDTKQAPKCQSTAPIAAIPTTKAIVDTKVQEPNTISKFGSPCMTEKLDESTDMLQDLANEADEHTISKKTIVNTENDDSFGSSPEPLPPTTIQTTAKIATNTATNTDQPLSSTQPVNNSQKKIETPSASIIEKSIDKSADKTIDKIIDIPIGETTATTSDESNADPLIQDVSKSNINKLRQSDNMFENSEGDNSEEDCSSETDGNNKEEEAISSDEELQETLDRNLGACIVIRCDDSLFQINNSINKLLNVLGDRLETKDWDFLSKIDIGTQISQSQRALADFKKSFDSRKKISLEEEQDRILSSFASQLTQSGCEVGKCVKCQCALIKQCNPMALKCDHFLCLKCYVTQQGVEEGIIVINCPDVVCVKEKERLLKENLTKDKCK